MGILNRVQGQSLALAIIPKSLQMIRGKKKKKLEKGCYTNSKIPDSLLFRHTSIKYHQ